MSISKQCVECSKDFSGSGRKCSACVKRAQRAKRMLVDTYPDIIVSTVAKLLPVDTNQAFSKQQAEALSLDKRAVHNTRAGKDEWVIPSSCKWGVCLNPKCSYHEVL